MKKNELILLRKLVTEEKERRVRINELLEDDKVIEYLKLTDTFPFDVDSDDMRVILADVLKSFSVADTNKLYVCTRAYRVDYDVCYEETNYYSHYVDIDSEDAEYKIYGDIESGELIKASRDSLPYCGLIKDFEENNTIFNPYNSNNNMNGYRDVRLDFFENSIKQGQAKSKKLLLNKYPTL